MNIKSITFIINPLTVNAWIRFGSILDIWPNVVSILFLELEIKKLFHGTFGFLKLLFLAILKLICFGFAANLLIVVISICSLCTFFIYNAIFRQIKEHIFHSINIVIAPRNHRKFNWYSIQCCNYLNSEPIEVFSHRRFKDPVFLPLNKLRATYKNDFTSRYRETVNNKFGRDV